MSLPEKASSPCLVKFLPSHCLTRPPVSFTVFPIPISLRAGVMLAFVASVRSSVRSSVQDLAYCETPRGTSGFPTGSEVKTLPVMQEMHIWPLGRDDSLEKEMTVHSSILAWRIPRTEKPGGLQSIRSWRTTHDWSDLACTHTFVHIYLPLQHVSTSKLSSVLIITVSIFYTLLAMCGRYSLSVCWS